MGEWCLQANWTHNPISAFNRAVENYRENFYSSKSNVKTHFDNVKKTEKNLRIRLMMSLHFPQNTNRHCYCVLRDLNKAFGKFSKRKFTIERWRRNKMPALERSIVGVPAQDQHRIGDGNTTLALHYAAARGCLDCVRLLVDSTPDLSANTQMDNDVTPVYLAAQEGHLDVLKFLVLEAGGSLYVRAKDGMAPIHAASQMGCLDCVKWMIHDQGVDPNLRDGDGATPLHFASSRGHLDTVRWLLKHGAKLSLDKFGKSPINDAAENQQVECLNILVQHRTSPTVPNNEGPPKICSCTARKLDPLKRVNSTTMECSNCTQKNEEPFYLHAPLEAPHAPQDGLYINPMNSHRHSTSISSSNSSTTSESFYLHNPQEVIYTRVKDLFDPNPQLRHNSNALTVKVEVHSSSSGAGSDENLSSSELSERSSGDLHEHDYEDIYQVREETKQNTNSGGDRRCSRDSGSHSRSSSTNSCGNNVDKESGLSSGPQSSEDDPVALNNRVVLKRTVSEPPPPPPPLPPGTVEIIEEPTLKPSQVVKGMCRTMSALSSSRRLNSSCSDLSVASSTVAVNLVNKQRVLPFVPPSFPPVNTANGLIKPSEYLKSLNSTNAKALKEDTVIETSGEEVVLPPVPPPLPIPNENTDISTNTLKKQQQQQQQPLAAISIQDLNSVQLRRTDHNTIMKTSKSFAHTPMRSMSLQCLQNIGVNEPFMAQKTDLITELKLSKDITGIRKMKIEKAKADECKERELYTEMSKQFTATNFVQKVVPPALKIVVKRNFLQMPDRDTTGNMIPAWKRQMMAKKAAEKARKELEEQMQRDAEEKRLQAIPQWKRQLIAKKEEAENRIKSTIYTPKIIDDTYQHQKTIVKISDQTDINNNFNSNPATTITTTVEINNPIGCLEDADDETNIIPWRAHLRKTNSKLNLLE